MSEGDTVQRALGDVQEADLRYDRGWFYLFASVLCWGIFWGLADQHHDNPHAQFLVWTIIFAAAWFTDNL